MLRTIAVWLVVLAQPLQACCSGICVPVPRTKAKSGCCQGPAQLGKSTEATEEAAPPKHSACASQPAKGPSCCKPAKKTPVVRSCCSVKKAPAKCGKACGPTTASSARAHKPPAAGKPVTPHSGARLAQSSGPGCRARHEGCCCCWPIPKDIPAPIGHKLPKPVLSAELAHFVPIQLADAEFPRFGGEVIASTWQSHSERQSTLCAWLK